MRWIIGVGLLVLMGCQKRQEQKPVLINKDSSDQLLAAQEEENDVQQEKYKKYWGYRFHILGDFDGDGKQEMLAEKLISTRTGKEIAKYCGFEEDSVADCWWTWRINWFRKPKCFLQSSNPHVADFTETIDSAGTRGLLFLQNEGDLNGDKTDEIVYVEDFGGCDSGFRGANLATYKNGKWNVLMNFTTQLGAFPELEQAETIINKPEDLSKPIVQQFERQLIKEPRIFKKQGKKVFYKEYGAPESILEELKINW